jgi:hypothetical protein
MPAKLDISEMALIAAATAIADGGWKRTRQKTSARIRQWAAKGFDAKALGEFLANPKANGAITEATYVNYLRLLWRAAVSEEVMENGRPMIPMATRIAAMEKIMATLRFIASTDQQVATWLQTSPVLTDPPVRVDDDDFAFPFGKVRIS